MASAGTEAKDKLIKRFIEAVGDDYLGSPDGKTYYFNSTENGQKKQVKITLTIPKDPLNFGEKSVIEDTGNWDWSEPAAIPAAIPAAPASTEITQEEQDNLRALLEKLGL